MCLTRRPISEGKIKDGIQSYLDNSRIWRERTEKQLGNKIFFLNEGETAITSGDKLCMTYSKAEVYLFVNAFSTTKDSGTIPGSTHMGHSYEANADALSDFNRACNEWLENKYKAGVLFAACTGGYPWRTGAWSIYPEQDFIGYVGNSTTYRALTQ